MNIAIIAHEKKKELMVQLCTAYKAVLSKHNICATAGTGNIIEEATGLSIQKILGGSQGGVQQIEARISYNEIDLVIYFDDPLTSLSYEPKLSSIIKLCDIHTIPVATNMATAEVLILGLDRGDLDWRNIIRG